MRGYHIMSRESWTAPCSPESLFDAETEIHATQAVACKDRVGCLIKKYHKSDRRPAYKACKALYCDAKSDKTNVSSSIDGGFILGLKISPRVSRRRRLVGPGKHLEPC